MIFISSRVTINDLSISPVCRLEHLEALVLEVFDVPPVLQPVHVGVEGKFEHMFNLETKTQHRSHT